MQIFGSKGGVKSSEGDVRIFDITLHHFTGFTKLLVNQNILINQDKPKQN